MEIQVTCGALWDTASHAACPSLILNILANVEGHLGILMDIEICILSTEYILHYIAVLHSKHAWMGFNESPFSSFLCLFQDRIK